MGLNQTSKSKLPLTRLKRLIKSLSENLRTKCCLDFGKIQLQLQTLVGGMGQFCGLYMEIKISLTQ